MTKIDWEAANRQRRQTPLLTDGMIKEYRQDAERLAKRVTKRKKQPKSSTGRTLDPEEKAAVAQKMGWTVADPKSPKITQSTDHDVPWWSDEELAAGKKGIAPVFDTGQTSSLREARPNSGNQCTRGTAQRYRGGRRGGFQS